ncbi:MAG TPA: hypothetical protein VGG75_16155 [Trebonia sp.]
MRVLRRVVIAVLALGVLGATGCSSLDKSMAQQDALVSFNANASNSVRLQVRAACGKLPGVTPAPLAKGVPLSSALSEVEYQINNADNADIARLQECLQKYPSVTGIDIEDSSDND